jgi:triphosphoribosyl-dephospho-CoA synthase
MREANRVTPSGNLLPASLLGQTACIWEVMARKAGNVHPLASFADLSMMDFLLSAAAMAPLLDDVPQRGVGATILEAVRCTRRITATNTNLGILLLLVPLAAVPRGQSLETGICSVLDALTVEDSRTVYSAIRLAKPGGLGQADEQDVSQEPTLPLRQIMALAADRDLIARQYAHGFHDVFTLGIPALAKWLECSWPLEEAVIFCHLRLMAALGDSLILRKRGQQEAHEVARQANAVLTVGWPEEAASRIRFREFDAWLRAEGHQRNPGATADLVAACLFAALREGNITLPLSMPWASTRL